MLPPEEHFINLMKNVLDVRKSDIIVVYDKYRNISAPRNYWMLKTFGAPEVYILNGTFAKWQKESRPIQSGSETDPFKRSHKNPAKEGDFDYKIDRSKVRVFEEMQKNVEDNQSGKGLPMFDARLDKYYHRCHIPTSKSLPFDKIMDKDYCFLPREEMIKVW